MLIRILVITEHLKNYLGIYNVDYDFSDYRTFKELFRDLYYKKTTIDDAEGKQDEFSAVISVLEGDAPRDNEYVEAKNKLLYNAKKFYIGREKIIEGFKNGVFPLYYNEAHEYQMKAQREIVEEDRRKKEEQEKQDEKTTDLNKFNKWIIDKEIDLNKKLFKIHFNFQKPSDMLMLLNRANGKEKNIELVNMINSGLKDLNKEIKNMSKKKIEIEKPVEIVRVAEMILKFNKQTKKKKV